MAQLIVNLKSQVLELTHSLGQVKAFEKDWKSKEEYYQSTNAGLESDLKKFQSQKLDSERHSKRLELSNSIQAKEISYLKEAIKSFEMEEKGLKGSSFDSTKSELIDKLQTVILELQTQVGTLQEELKTEKHKYSEDSRAQMEALEEQLEVMREKLGVGAYHPSAFRVLQLADNPESRVINARLELVESLKAENVKLREQLSVTQTTTGPLSIPMESILSLEKQLADLSDQVKSKETMILRLKQVFGTKIQEYRQMVQSLLGNCGRS